MKTFLCAQGSSEWAALRLGVVTASEVDALISPLAKIRTGQGVQTYMHLKLAESLMGYAGKTGGTFSMNQGNVIEDIAVPWYEFTYDVKVDRVGFCTSDDGRVGFSPDALVGEDGGVEIKSPQAPAMCEYLLGGIVPAEYIMQIQMSLYVSGRKWWDFVAFHRYLSPLVIRVYPDPKAQEALKTALSQFLSEFDIALAKLKAMQETKGRAA